MLLVSKAGKKVKKKEEKLGLNKVLTIPETPPSNRGLLPSLSTTSTATPVINNYNNKRQVAHFQYKSVGL